MTHVGLDYWYWLCLLAHDHDECTRCRCQWAFLQIKTKYRIFMEMKYFVAFKSIYSSTIELKHFKLDRDFKIVKSWLHSSPFTSNKPITQRLRPTNRMTDERACKLSCAHFYDDWKTILLASCHALFSSFISVAWSTLQSALQQPSLDTW